MIGSPTPRGKRAPAVQWNGPSTDSPNFEEPEFHLHVHAQWNETEIVQITKMQAISPTKRERPLGRSLKLISLIDALQSCVAGSLSHVLPPLVLYSSTLSKASSPPHQYHITVERS